MADSSDKDLLAKAQECSANNIDLYELLQVEHTEQDEKKIRSAWRKQSIKYHPDKAKDAYDPEKWELFEFARDILLDTAARAAYDNARKAALRQKAERLQRVGADKRFADALEADEREAKRQRLEKEERARELERERARLREEGQRENERRMAEEAERFKREQLERAEREREPDELDERMAELERRLEEKRRLKAEKKARKKGKTDGGDPAPPAPPAPASAPAPAVPRAPPKWEDTKAKMLAFQKIRDAKKAAAEKAAAEKAAAEKAAAEAGDGSKE
ncbi:hypothetical protein CkaCkLH20_09810 [Colletotrichum karsti]|uniref:J domain-containing protein n=1 Tax=Colletotrichum karsti TaxID=1095194 RepID=A0A9P6I252_9PEZI|nr:uncharacterized protein CkaCkLH20_09810 [Colletotrichum karsti]KAF9872631.1 hypothetical protein CkaCkLH20_09810 [Colletotrichum karsti]